MRSDTILMAVQLQEMSAHTTWAMTMIIIDYSYTDDQCEILVDIQLRVMLLSQAFVSLIWEPTSLQCVFLPTAIGANILIFLAKIWVHNLTGSR